MKNKIRELEKEIRQTRSIYRKRDLNKHLKRLLKAQKYGAKNDKFNTKKNKNLQRNFEN